MKDVRKYVRRDDDSEDKLHSRIIVQFSSDKLLESDVLAYDYSRYLTKDELNQFAQQFKNLKIERLFSSIRDAELNQLGDLLTYFTIVCPKTVIPDVLTLVKKFGRLIQAYIAPVPKTPAVHPNNNPIFKSGRAKFLQSAPEGIDVAH